ncbi:patatin-like phospholipase/acyl hydrolase [Natranaerovirga pectinivora]|uniref:Patatin-like phospholipase/acyl hydrolase n=1 Tax=Natranaerovirga pectinivora TaxID=682400 RepID=A0A4R3MMK3_9FIRM|nr:CBASS cGAMP-activated phospholipase [Natranaerovirga pectinivora]TCT16185.1 patatin-like phospholipase/acyl hydrolase [Natranaerovirga pectinivora]
MSKKTVRILSIDGGGVRGLIPALILKALSKEINGKAMYKSFDIIAGTSTGALIALLLSAPKIGGIPYSNRTDLISDLYETKSHLIFNQNWQIIRTIFQLFKPKYNTKYLSTLLDEYFSQATLKDSLTNIIIPSFDMQTMKPFFFKHLPPSHNNGYQNFYLRDVALASTAAPTYFPAHYAMPINSKNTYCFVDGGLYANNPTLCAYAEARKIYPDAEEFIFVSLGTGKNEKSFLCKDVKNWGLIGWVNPFNSVPLLSSFMYSQESSANHLVSKIPNTKLYRLNPIITNRQSDIDNASPVNIDSLKKTTLSYINENYKVITEIAKHL